MTTIISFVIVLGVLIFIHELGHFAVAKWCGVGVEKFSLGFGPKLVGFTRGETEYKIALLPLGGYVKMVGEGMDEEVSDEDKEKSFTLKPIKSRAAIVAAGSVMNLLLAAILMPIIYMIGVSAPAYLDKPAEVGYVVEGEAASDAGLLKGDLIVSANGSEVTDWEELVTILALSPGRELNLGLKRDGVLINKTITPAASEMGSGVGGFFPPMKPTIGALSAGYPAMSAGLKEGDVITSIDGTPITHWAELEMAVHDNGSEMLFEVKRNSTWLDFKITPKLDEARGVHLIGVSRSEEMVIKKYGFFESIKQGLTMAVEMTAKLFVIIKGLILGDYSLKTLGGPIMIAQVAGQAAESGLPALLSLVAFLSLQLGIINLFPIPVLDGGHMVFLGIELVRRKPLSERVMSVAQHIGLALLLSLMVLVTWNDILRVIKTYY